METEILNEILNRLDSAESELRRLSREVFHPGDRIQEIVRHINAGNMDKVRELRLRGD